MKVFLLCLVFCLLSLQVNAEIFSGYNEIKSNVMQDFTKWNSVKNSNSTEVYNLVENFKNYSDIKKLETVNKAINKIKYIEDKDNYYTVDYWATPKEFFKNGGDCEDYALTKYIALKSIGIQDKQMRITIVQDITLNIKHAVLIVDISGKSYILDNQYNEIKQVSSLKQYIPLYSVNMNSWWQYKPINS